MFYFDSSLFLLRRSSLKRYLLNALPPENEEQGGRNPAWSAVVSVWLSTYTASSGVAPVAGQTSASDSRLALSAQTSALCRACAAQGPSRHPAAKVFQESESSNKL